MAARCLPLYMLRRIRDISLVSATTHSDNSTPTRQASRSWSELLDPESTVLTVNVYLGPIMESLRTEMPSHPRGKYVQFCALYVSVEFCGRCEATVGEPCTGHWQHRCRGLFSISSRVKRMRNFPPFAGFSHVESNNSTFWRASWHRREFGLCLLSSRLDRRKLGS